MSGLTTDELRKIAQIKIDRKIFYRCLKEMNMAARNDLLSDKETLEWLNKITEKIIGCSFKVSNTLGVGFVEKVYENALAHELRVSGLQVEQQESIKVRYEGLVVGEFAADILVERQVIIELKAVRALENVHNAQCLNYLKATGLRICMLINFGKSRIDIKRFIN